MEYTDPQNTDHSDQDHSDQIDALFDDPRAQDLRDRTLRTLDRVEQRQSPIDLDDPEPALDG